MVSRKSNQVIRLHDKGPKRVKPMTFQKPCQMASGNVAMRFEQKRSSVNQSAAACASSNDAIGDAFRSIKFGSRYHTVGGSDHQSSLCHCWLSFDSYQLPARASIPFDKDRNGFVMGFWNAGSWS